MRAAPSSSAPTRAVDPTSAKEAVERGLQQFKERKDYAEAVRLFTLSLAMQPNEEEALAACYNLGCAHARLKQWKPAADAIVQAVNEHRLKLTVPLQARGTPDQCMDRKSLRIVVAPATVFRLPPTSRAP